jgi:class 3 adenylate cyclase/uncharacterized RDD family membrane protein YckC
MLRGNLVPANPTSAIRQFNSLAKSGRMGSDRHPRQAMHLEQTTRSQNLSIMLVDMQGYTKTSAASSRDEIVGLIRRYNQLMQPVIDFYRGRIVKGLGDAFLCSFGSATDAVVCSVMIQLLFNEYNAKQKDTKKKINLRVVVNTGDVTIENDDIFGDAVNITSRVEALDVFGAGDIGITEATYLMINRNEIAATKVGEFELKGVPEPVRVYRVPLEKQKLTDIPAGLLLLVEQVIEGGATQKKPSQNVKSPTIETGEAIDSGEANEELRQTPTNGVYAGTGKGARAFARIGAGSIAETGFEEDQKTRDYSIRVKEFLKTSAIGAEVGRFTRDLTSQITKSISDNFDEAIAAQQGKVSKPVSASSGEFLLEASVQKRMKAFLVDLVLIIILVFPFRIAWWVTQSIFYGPVTKTIAEGQKTPDDRYFESVQQSDGSRFLERRMSRFEGFVNYNLRKPWLPIAAYLAFFWWVIGQTIGQVVTRTKVVTIENRRITLGVAIKRALLFIFSALILGIGFLLLLSERRATLYDRMCETKVIEEP